MSKEVVLTCNPQRSPGWPLSLVPTAPKWRRGSRLKPGLECLEERQMLTAAPVAAQPTLHAQVQRHTNPVAHASSQNQQQSAAVVTALANEKSVAHSPLPNKATIQANASSASLPLTPAQVAAALKLAPKLDKGLANLLKSAEKAIKSSPPSQTSIASAQQQMMQLLATQTTGMQPLLNEIAYGVGITLLRQSVKDFKTPHPTRTSVLRGVELAALGSAILDLPYLIASEGGTVSANVHVSTIPNPVVHAQANYQLPESVILSSQSMLAAADAALKNGDLFISGLSQAYQNSARQISNALPNAVKLATSLSYFAGLTFSIGAVMKFKQHKDNPTQIPISVPITYTVLAAAFLFAPAILNHHPSNPLPTGDGTTASNT